MKTKDESITPVIGIHGLQGSGKTYLTTIISNMILSPNHKIKMTNIKSTFMPIADVITHQYKEMGYELNESQRKQLLLSVSTFGELYVNEMIWTKEWVKAVNASPDSWIITDDIRTGYNITGLLELAKTRPVIVFRLDVPECVRRSRLGNKYRENGGYTEKLLEAPAPTKNLKWVNLSEDWTLTDIKNAMKEYV
jgi:thymidylate kinase